MTPERRKRNTEIRANVDRLRREGFSRYEAWEMIGRTYGLKADTVRKICEDIGYETRYEERTEKH